ncbi:Protein CBG27773 [Caenorhabditis briggsae]|uniref:Protein CBG27773 n=1 Tax=Caenorhabditis briggsae TaxID=6238 RepID=B6II10_CAEBR|nr:Protein CBG27773 [Caenorhabditis briggsae]CAR99540.1 Protein CBG27773 [Caenorhabditis briggsae]
MNDSFLENNDAEKFKNEYLECSENFTNAFLETQQAKININNKKAIWNETVNKINEAENQLKAMNDPYQLFEEKMEQSYVSVEIYHR